MLIPVVRPRKHGAPFVPDDLLRIKKADAQESVENFARKDGGVPDVSYLKTRRQFERLRPICPGVPGDGRFGVALSAALNVTGLGGPAAI